MTAMMSEQPDIMTPVTSTPAAAHGATALIDMGAVRAALVKRAADVAVALLGAPNRQLSGRRELRFGNKGSLGVVIAGVKAGCWYDHEAGVGGDIIELIERERSGGFRDAISYAQEIIGASPTQPKSRGSTACGRLVAGPGRYQRRAGELWQEAVPIADTTAARYLARRSLHIPHEMDGRVLRFHPTCPFDGTRHPCLLALMLDVRTNEPRAIQRTALTQAGEKIGRRALGPKIGAAIKLSADENVTMGLVVGEGLETVLSAMELGFNPAWALGDAGNVRGFPVLSGIECLTIIVDNDESGTGQRAALECSSRWTDAGREVFRIIPDCRGSDMNNIIQGVVV